VPRRYVAIWAHDHHSLWVSRAALSAASIDRDTADPDGGLIRRDDAGEPSGVLHESAARLVTGHIGRVARALRDADPGLAGDSPAWVSSPSDPGGLSPRRAWARDRRVPALDERGMLPIRVTPVREEQIEASGGARSGAPRAWPEARRALIGWLKLFADGRRVAVAAS
jgi:predicted amidohydrolase YtcJ